MRVTHIITGLSDGGAEAVLARLCLAKVEDVSHTVISLTGRGKYGDLLERAGVSVVSIGLGSLTSLLRNYGDLVRAVEASSPDIVQTWMYHANLLGGVAARSRVDKPIVWGVRNTAPDRSVMKWRTRMTVRLGGLLSKFVPSRIVVCAENAVESHVRIGFARQKITVIQNGTDVDRFKKSTLSNCPFREEIGIDDDTCLLGMVARYNEQKDHENLIRALAILRDRGVDFRCILVGVGMATSNSKLVELLEENHVRDLVTPVGPMSKVEHVMASLDIHVLSSKIEGFPNVLAEAMACGTPCVSCDVGDASEIVGETGWIVPKQDASALALALEEAIAEYRDFSQRWEERRQLCRDRIVTNFALERMVGEYYDLWAGLARDHATARES